jgi:leader peptidase (prepilin peptidase) / N-methyltransferase
MIGDGPMLSRRPAGNAPGAMNYVRQLTFIFGPPGIAAAIASIWLVPGSGGWLGAVLALLMLVIAAVDFRHLIIPNELTIAALALAVLNAALEDTSSIVEAVAAAALRGLATMLLFLALRTIYRWLRHREGIGLGDVKLGFVAGAWLDWPLIPVSIEVAALVALAAYVTRQSMTKQPYDATARLPFGLFFAPSIWLSWLVGAVMSGVS